MEKETLRSRDFALDEFLIEQRKVGLVEELDEECEQVERQRVRLVYFEREDLVGLVGICLEDLDDERYIGAE